MSVALFRANQRKAKRLLKATQSDHQRDQAKQDAIDFCICGVIVLFACCAALGFFAKSMGWL